MGGHRERVLIIRDRLVNSHMDLVPPIAARIHHTLPAAFELDDLLATGYLALVHAATRYRPQIHGGCPFSAFARPRIRGAILNSVRRHNWEESTRAPPPVGQPERGAVSDIETAIDAQSVFRAVEQLSEPQRRIVAEYYRDTDATYKTVGAALGLTKYRIELEHSNAIQELRKLLKKAA